MPSARTLKVLLVEDDSHHAKTLQKSLKNRGHDVLWAADAGRAITSVELSKSGEAPIQLAVVDLDLGSGNDDGLHLIRELRRRKFQMPIIVLTGTGRSMAMEESIRAGANDFVYKGTSSGEQAAVAADALYELAFRIAQSPTSGQTAGWITFGRLTLDGAEGDVYVGGSVQEKMQPMPFRILHHIASRDGGANADDIMQKCKVSTKESLHTHISQIRKALGRHAIVGGRWGANYRLNKKEF